MALHIESEPSGATACFDGDLTIFQVADYRTQLLSIELGNTPLVADLSAVSEIDGAGLQLLIALQKQQQAAASQLTLRAPAPAVTEALGMCNLQGFFQVEPVAEG